MATSELSAFEPSERKILEQWMGSLDLAQVAHYSAATKYEKRQYQLGLPVVVLTTLVGTSVFASLTHSDSSGGVLVSVFVATMSLLAAILSAVQTFFGYSVRAERHRMAGVQFGILKRKVERLLHFSLERRELTRRVADLVDRWDGLSKASPAVPQKIWDDTCRYHESQRAKRQAAAALQAPPAASTPPEDLASPSLPRLPMLQGRGGGPAGVAPPPPSVQSEAA